MMRRLFKDTGVDFYHYLEILRKSSNAFNQDSHWIHLDATDDLVNAARARVFVPVKKDRRGKGEGNADGAPPPPDNGGTLNLEVPPKWNALQTLLQEIHDEISAEEASLADVGQQRGGGGDDRTNRTVIFVDN